MKMWNSQLESLDCITYVPTLPIFYEWEIPDSHLIIFIVKTQLLFVYLTYKLISNIFFRCENGFSHSQKTGTVGTYEYKKNKE